VPALWFRAKRQGWGWTPVTWQGWAVMFLYLVALAVWLPYGLVRGITHGWQSDLMTAGGVIALTLILVAVCWLKGERPH
jgi:hypothetical protein